MGKKLLGITVLIMVLGLFLNIFTLSEKENLPKEPPPAPQTPVQTSAPSKETSPLSPEPPKNLIASEVTTSHPHDFEISIPPWEIYSQRVYEDVRLTQQEIIHLNDLNGQAQKKLYALIQEIENSSVDREEALNKAMEQVAFEREKAQIEILGESRYQILMQEKKRYAEEIKRLTGLEYNTESW